MRVLSIIIISVLLAACQTSKTVSDKALNNIHHGIIKANKDQIAEICPEMKAGQVIAFELTASLPILFNLHFHQGKAISYPIPKKNLTEIKDQFTAPDSNTYCLMWKTHLDNTKVKYQYYIR